MAFQQLYYTSCQTGLLGYGGFQFNAVTPGLSTAVLREVEELTSYEPPRDMPADPAPDQLASYPVAFSYSPGSTGSSITARTVFAGADYSGRPGNYFVHALVTDSAADYGPLLPIQLWDAPLWRTEPVPATDLPPLPGPLPQGPLGRASVQRLVEGSDRALLPVLLTAVGQAMAGERPVLLAGQDSAANAAWIAAVSYLLGRLAWRLSFTTYTSRPAYSRHHLIGVLDSGGPVTADQGFQVCDPSAGRTPELAVHPLATLLARTGVLAAEGLWSAAAGLASGQEAGFDDWYPVLAAASALGGNDLDPQDLAAITTWLRGDRGSRGTRVLAKLLDLVEKGGPGSGVPVADLHALGAHVSSETLRQRLDGLAIDEALSRLKQGKPADAPVKLYTGAARQRAAQEVLALLRAIPPEANAWALVLLEWAQDVGAALPTAALRQYGYSDFDPFGGDAPVLDQILSGWPAIVSGLVAKLAERPGMASELLESPGRAAVITKVIGLADLGDHHELAELWLLSAVARGELTPLAALTQIMKRHGPGQADAALMSKLWPDRCPPDDLSELLKLPQLRGIDDWLAEQVTAALADQSSSGQAAMLRALGTRPDVQKRLRPETRQLASNLSTIGELTAKARGGNPKALARLYKAYPTLDGSAATRVRQEVIALLATSPQLWRDLHGCPPELRAAFCKHIHKDLKMYNANAELAARVFAAYVELSDGRTKEDKAAAAALGDEIVAVLDWRRGQLRAMRRALDKRYVTTFEDWQQEYRGGTVRGLLRSFTFRKDGD